MQYERLWTNPQFLNSLQRTLLFVLYTVPATLVLAMALAVLGNLRLRRIGIFRMVFSLTIAVSAATASLIFLYLLIRFRRWQFSLGAVLALFHDVLITLTFFTLLHGIVPFSLEIDQAIIACILTVIGYSVNDTVIVYDRIREFMHTFAGRRKEEVFNLAINTTLSRTLMTSGTLLLVVVMLFVFGGSAIRGFSFGMLVGILFGTYSSIFVASALVVDMTKEEVISGKAPVTTAAEKPVAPSVSDAKKIGKKAVAK
jgi:preprotein translocase subunit SecF